MAVLILSSGEKEPTGSENTKYLSDFNWQSVQAGGEIPRPFLF